MDINLTSIIYVYLYVYIYTCTHTCIYIHTYTHKYIYRVETMDTKLTPINVFDAALADLQLETEQLSKKWEVSICIYVYLYTFIFHASINYMCV
jgi:hypothetical protein